MTKNAHKRKKNLLQRESGKNVTVCTIFLRLCHRFYFSIHSQRDPMKRGKRVAGHNNLPNSSPIVLYYKSLLYSTLRPTSLSRSALPSRRYHAQFSHILFSNSSILRWSRLVPSVIIHIVCTIFSTHLCSALPYSAYTNIFFR